MLGYLRGTEDVGITYWGNCEAHLTRWNAWQVVKC